ncbi:hypothetical protein MPTK1_7g19450 [Marchantia polymorpha subsp. ruderalis]|uniref:Uncharacterized protein n=2 Tax=Marchantia polymorpha TaxID=3197 RepID=A0AAF6C1G0_MARPO|nr:hypothetical protein MARPO_0067s0033 [Marchantia polymorpha]BBN18094.1 hypothetical protein Mp_7g19450 [Marchantia polymorpha subsp. ruderalis]|eukprot:PTQ35940.1 hypothetical protein MARPO_0067s0033 [Marchantia polymorpha]
MSVASMPILEAQCARRTATERLSAAKLNGRGLGPSTEPAINKRTCQAGEEVIHHVDWQALFQISATGRGVETCARAHAESLGSLHASPPAVFHDSACPTPQTRRPGGHFGKVGLSACRLDLLVVSAAWGNFLQKQQESWSREAPSSGAA